MPRQSVMRDEGPRSHSDAAPAGSEELSFIRYMQNRLEAERPKTKGERTRVRLKIAAAQALETHGYTATRVIDITQGAGVAEGLFYSYFKDKASIALEVLEELLRDFFANQTAHGADLTALGAIRSANRRWLKMAQANSGLIRCILQIGDQMPGLAQLAQGTNRVWYERVARSALRRRSRTTLTEPQMRLLVYMLGGMMDELTRGLIIYPDPELGGLLADLDMSLDDVADAASVLWYHVLYPGEPVHDALSGLSEILSEWIKIR